MFIGASTAETLAAAETVVTPNLALKDTSYLTAELEEKFIYSKSATVAKYQRLAEELSIWLSLGGIQEICEVIFFIVILLVLFSSYSI